jgi:molecular chaperone IbpB/HSP20 family protein
MGDASVSGGSNRRLGLDVPGATRGVVMKHHDFPDLGKLMDEIFSAAEDFTSVFTDRMQFHPGEKAWKWNREYYSSYPYPPANIYMTEAKVLVFEFAIAGFAEKDIDLQFKGDYMVFSGTVPEGAGDPSDARYFKRRLKLKSFADQRYYVPADKFDRDRVSAIYRNGVLKVTIPPKEEVPTEEGTKINIVNDDPAESDTGSGPAKGKGSK